MKRKWGPFYPDAQFDLDQLVLMGLVDISDISWQSNQEGVWKSARYQITPTGFSLAADVTSASTRFMSTYRFLVDMCSAYSSIDDDKAEEASRKDLTIAQPGYRSGAVIDFTGIRNNMSVRGVQAFVDAAPEIAKPNRQQQIRLYMKYLEGEAA